MHDSCEYNSYTYPATASSTEYRVQGIIISQYIDLHSLQLQPLQLRRCRVWASPTHLIPPPPPLPRFESPATTTTTTAATTTTTTIAMLYSVSQARPPKQCAC